ncbi:fatty acid desaturase [Actinoplanes sp. NBC_00393]|uniref:cytochrome b5 domain-containing protein n=1 Tax=Actinoplanes sp. NBC_00393 TaxID=2975953 RepID=UPI002E1F0783
MSKLPPRRPGPPHRPPPQGAHPLGPDLALAERDRTGLPRPFWIVDGEAYDFSEWMDKHPGGGAWFAESIGRDISALFHTYHRDPQRLRTILAKYRIDDVGAGHVIPNLGLPPFLLPDGFDAATDLPRFEFAKPGDLRTEIVREVERRAPRERLLRYDRVFDAISVTVLAGHLAVLAALLLGALPAWACVLLMVLTRTALAGSGHFYLHRRKPRRPARVLSPGMLPSTLFDFNYVGTYLVGVDGHVILHHPYLGSGADIKGAFLGALRRVHPALRIPAYTVLKLGMALGGIARLGFPIIFGSTHHAGIRAEFWLVRGFLAAEFVACAVTGHWLAWLAQFVLTLWFNTVLITASHDFEPDERDAPVDGLPDRLRDDWAARQIHLSYDLTIIGNKWADVFLSAGLNTHRVHHTLPFQRSGFANLASEPAVRAACETAGMVWERPRNLFTERFPVFVRTYLTAPAVKKIGAGRYLVNGWRTGED